MKGSEKQIALANSIITEMNDIIQKREDKELARIEKIITKGKDPSEFIAKNAPYNYYSNLIKSIVLECDDATKIIDSSDEIIRSIKKGGTKLSWGGIAFLVGGMSRSEINSDKHTYMAGE